MDALINFWHQTGFYQILGSPNALIMILVACLLLYLAIVKKFEPLLLLPIAFGMLLTNLIGADMYHEALFAGGHVHWEMFGSGIPLADGSGIKVTTSSYFTPGGTCVQGIGITPDYVVPLADEDKNTDVTKLDKSRDTQLQKAEELLNK